MDKQLAKVALALAKACGRSSLTDRFKKAILSSNYVELTKMSFNPSESDDIGTVREDFVLSSLFKKTRFSVPGVDAKTRREAAEALFLKYEAQCYRTNQRFLSLIEGDYSDVHPDAIAHFDVLRRKIRWALGPIPNQLDLRFGKGSTFETRGLCATIADKIENEPSMTRSLEPVTSLWEETAWARSIRYRQRGPRIVRGNRFTTVPKTAIVDRGICVEPSLNVSFQLALGRHIRSRLKHKLRVDLDFGQGYHQDLAQLASRDGSMATLDLSGASDTVAYHFLRYILPGDWFELLCFMRSSHTLFQERWVRLEKFSSMGNGYTFELESLVFKCICDTVAEACGTSPLANYVYGDDMIVPAHIAGATMSFLRYCGFSINEEKSFVDGPFRESCGGDFFKGKPTRAYYLKDLPAAPQHWIALANGIRRMAHLEPGDDFRSHPYYPAWCRCLDAIPTAIRRLRGPESLGDTVIHDDRWRKYVRPVYFDTLRGVEYAVDDGELQKAAHDCGIRNSARSRKRPGVNDHQTWTYRLPCYAPVQRKLSWAHWRGSVVLATCLYGAGDSEGLIPRDGVTGHRIVWVNV